MTFIIESIGALILTIRFTRHFSFFHAMYLGIFHAISAFNNAGFSLFSDSLMKYKGDIIVNGIVMVLIIAGSIGFIILIEGYKYLRKDIHHLSLHTKITLITTILLTLIGAFLIYLFETMEGSTFAGQSLKVQVLSSLFQSISARTAGFNTVNIGNLTSGSLFTLIVLMIIGGSPGSTAGGIKTTTFAVMIIALWNTFRGREDVNVFGRRIPSVIVARAFLLTTLMSIVIIMFTTVLLLTENQPLLRTLFEVASAFGTVGYSTGNGDVLSFSALFSNGGKLLIALTMYIGRLGPLWLSIAVVKGTTQQRYRFIEEKVIIG